MSKRINTPKLKAMGIERVRAVCIRHATRAIEFKAEGNTKKYEMHCALLDQCGAVGRELLRHRVKIEVDAATLI